MRWECEDSMLILGKIQTSQFITGQIGELLLQSYQLPAASPAYISNQSYNFFSFGFIHDQKFSTPQEEKKTLEKKLEVLVHREKKWVKMISKWGSKSTKEKLSKRIHKGIPDKVRKLTYQVCHSGTQCFGM